MPPIYDYNCKACSHEYEVFYTTQSAVAKEERAEKCPKCSSTKKKKVVSKRVSFQLKGPGWYKDGY